MPKFAANLTMMYPELPFLDRFEAAANDGFNAVEFLFPYAYRADELRARLTENGLALALFNTPPGGVDATSINAAWIAGDRGSACVPGREDEFRTGFALALAYARALACPRVHTMVGLIAERTTREATRALLISNLRWAASEATKDGVEILIEPINTRDIPRFFLNRQDEAHEIVQAVGATNLKVQMDLYHCQIVEGDVATKVRTYLPTGRVGHFQIAGVPERHEPSIGELNYPYLFDLIDALGYDGWIGCEYKPKRGGEAGGTTSGLDWMRAYLSRG
jgi:2-dehydrotetronate isomerase